jgi:hypothetical protein
MGKYEVLKNAKELIKNRLQSAPEYTIFQSIDAQLNYLKDFIDGAIIDRRKLNDINVGLYAVREFEESDPELAKALKKIQYITDKLLRGVKVD